MAAPDTHATTFDVAVVGGGAAGVAAAIGAAQSGAKVVLVERYGFLGGAATNASVLAYCGLFKQGPTAERCVGGVVDLVLDELRLLGQRTEPFRTPSTGNWILPLEPEPLKLALDRAVEQSGVALRLHSLVSDTVRAGSYLRGIRVTDHSGTETLVASTFVDASGEGDLARLSGVAISEGGPDGNPLQAASMPLRIGGVPREVDINRDHLREMVRHHNRASNHPILREDGGIMLRLPRSHEIWWLVVDVASGGLSGHDLTRAETHAREMAWQFVESLRRHMPGFGEAYLLGSGPQIGVRETRHPAARAQVSAVHARAGARLGDGVALAGWPMENHYQAGKPVYESIGGDGLFHVPLDALRADGIDNLWLAGRIIGTDAAAFGSIRVMGTAFATGHAAGVAAAIQANLSSDFELQIVQNTLRAQGAML